MTGDFPAPIQFALSNMKRERRCPPLRVLRAGVEDGHLQRHLEGCPYCRDRMEQLSDLEECVVRPAPSPAGLPAPGQIWEMRPERGGWGPGDRWYATATVLVINRIGAKGVRVAMVCELEELAMDDDVLLKGGFAGFAEPWNSFPLMTDDLAEYLGDVGEEVLQAVLDGERNAGRAGLPIPLADFRKMEMDTAVFHARRAALALTEGGLLDDAEDGGQGAEADGAPPGRRECGVVLDFSPPGRARMFRPQYEHDDWQLAAASAQRTLFFRSEEEDLHCTGELHGDGHITFSVKATPGNEPVFIALVRVDDKNAILLSDGDGRWTSAAKLDSFERIRFLLHPEADVDTEMQLFVWQEA